MVKKGEKGEKVVDFLYCLVCLREILLHNKNQNMEEIQGGHCPCSEIQGGQPTTLPPPCRAPGSLLSHETDLHCRRKRAILVILTLDSKVKVIRQHEKGICSRQLATEFVFGKTQMNNIVTAKPNILKLWDDGVNGNCENNCVFIYTDTIVNHYIACIVYMYSAYFMSIT